MEILCPGVGVAEPIVMGRTIFPFVRTSSQSLLAPQATRLPVLSSHLAGAFRAVVTPELLRPAIRANHLVVKIRHSDSHDTESYQ
jgi:hypothetical protein